MLFSPLSRHLIPRRFKYPPQHPVPKHPQSNVTDQVSHPYKTVGKILVLYILTSGAQPRVAVALSGDWLNDIVTFLDVFVPSCKNNPFTQPIVGLRYRWSSREYDDLSLIFCEALSILACYTTVLYAPI
jgi:hypothetical protein